MAVTAVADGVATPVFSDDSFGGTKPMMVVVPDDWAGLGDHRWIVILSIDGSGDEGGFYQELPSYPRIGENEGLFRVAGHPAVRLSSQSRGSETRRTAAFVAINTSAGASDDLRGGEQRGLLVTGTVEDLDLLETVARSAGADDERTPTLDKVPDGWHVLSTLSASQATGPNEGAIEYQPVGRRVVLLGDPVGGDLLVTAFEGDSTMPLLKAIETMWNPYDLESFDDVHQFKVDAADAALTVCCTDNGLASRATAWFSLNGAPFSVNGPASLLDTPNRVMAFAARINLATEDEWTAAKIAVPTTSAVPNLNVGVTATTLAAPSTTTAG